MPVEAHETDIAANLPSPPRDHLPFAVALGLLAIGAGVLALVLSGALSSRAVPAPPPIVVVTHTPLPGAAKGKRVQGRIVAAPPNAAQAAEIARFERAIHSHVPARWVANFYPLYETASRTFGVNWLLLASVHKQETAFSTARGTYHGLNFLGCCGGPMQFNVRNGPVTTWDLVRDSFVYAQRPAGYAHQTSRHPSIYDDFDAMMAAARLLAADGASARLDFGAWTAAYDYYGPSIAGVTYADQVVARAISWSQHGFCINCGLDATLVAAVHAAYGAPVLATLERVRHRVASKRRRGSQHRPAPRAKRAA
jgi:hypothetical protein